MTKLCNTGWEADRLYKNSVTATFTTPSHPINLQGYRFKLAMIPSDAPFIGTYASAQVLFWCAVFGIQNTDDWGSVVLADATGAKQNLHGGATANTNIIAVSILKASPWTSAVNDYIAESGWSITVPPKSTVQMFAAHAGQGPVDFEVQGGLIYGAVGGT
jgi:hypothetical protein